MSSRPTLTRLQRRLVGTVITLTVAIAGIGFAGSYTAVRSLAESKGFGGFAVVFPIGLDAGIVVLLALDLLLTWLRIPFPMLRPTAWLLTAATIAFNASTAWPDPVGTGMHGVIPVLFVVAVEAGRHALGRIAAITADRDMDTVRLSRWLLSPWPTFKLWRRMKLWELRSYEHGIRLEQDRLVYRAQLRAAYGRRWRWRAPVQDLLQLRLARYGRPLGEPVAQLVAKVQHPGNAFDAAADEVVALAPSAAPAALDPAPPQQDVQQPATPLTYPEPTNTVPPGARLLPVTCRSYRDTPSTSTPPPVAPAPLPPRPAVQQPAAPGATGRNALAPLTVADVAQRFGVTRTTVRSWVSRGKLTPLPRTVPGAPNTFDPAAVAALDMPVAPPVAPTPPDHMEGGYA